MLFGPTVPRKILNLLEKAQIEAARMITGFRVDTCKLKDKELGLKTLQSRRDEHKLILVYKINNGLALQYL